MYRYLSLIIYHANSETIEVPVTSLLDTAEEVLIYDAGHVPVLCTGLLGRCCSLNSSYRLS